MPFPLPIVLCALANFLKIFIGIPAGAFGRNLSVIFFSSENFVITSTVPWLAVLVLTGFHCTEDLSKSAWCRICLERDRSLTGKG